MRQDPLFVFLLHTGGGFIGMFLTGCFARYVALDEDLLSMRIAHHLLRCRQYVVGFDGFSKILDRTVGERLQ